MSLSASETKEAVATLRDRLKHGQNMTKILESQLDTAQQNISLLQGQVRLANETILNLKKYFSETENTLNELLLPNHASSRVFRFDSEHRRDHDNELSQKHGNVDSTTRSPIPTDTSSNGDNHKHHEDKRECNNKSPYAQQLRQVLDVLQDEEPRKSLGGGHHHEMSSSASSHKDCACADCQLPPVHSSRTKQQYHDPNYANKRSSSENEYVKPKHKGNNRRSESNREPSNISPKSFQRGSHNDTMHGHASYSSSSHCNGPCCTSDGGYKMMEKSSHYHDNEKPAVHYLEKSPTSMHYINVHSPDLPEVSTQHGSSGERHHSHHCSDKCSCRPTTPGYMPGYAPYGYHMVENLHGIPHDAVQPMSPNGRRKRPFIALMPNEEPPHLKYTKVKRIDGSKLTAQKVLQDFTKRRFIAYNPRYDLDLLIVPPPIPAIELLKGNNTHNPLRISKKPTNDRCSVSQPHGKKDKIHEEDRQLNSSVGSHSLTEKSDDSLLDEEPQMNDIEDDEDDEDAILNDQNNNNTNNTNNNNNTFPSCHNLYSPSKGVTAVLPSIKEEPRTENREPRSKLEDHISKLRNEQNANSNSSYYKKGGKNSSPSYNKNNDSKNSTNPDTIGAIMSQSNVHNNMLIGGEKSNSLHEQLTR